MEDPMLEHQLQNEVLAAAAGTLLPSPPQGMVANLLKLVKLPQGLSCFMIHPPKRKIQHNTESPDSNLHMATGGSALLITTKANTRREKKHKPMGYKAL